jgi:hypothetical protein
MASAKTYSAMQIEDYLPYKEARAALPIGLFGPQPLYPRSCICGRYIVDDYCKCATSCLGTTKHKWATENPEAYQAEQAQMAKWRIIFNHWQKQYAAVQNIIHCGIAQHVTQFERLRDEESAIGCYKCELTGLDYCECDYCYGCGDKYCCSCGYDSY